jgi:hypothetical protein
MFFLYHKGPKGGAKGVKCWSQSSLSKPCSNPQIHLFLEIQIPQLILYLVIVIPRTLLPILKNRFNQGKATVLFGPRQVGKTILIHACLIDAPFLFLNEDDLDVLALL